jgi:uncharacterized protein (UPF0276 family)
VTALLAPSRAAASAGPDPIPAAAGIGLRFQHHRVVAETRPELAWLEVHTENYMGGGMATRYLESIRRDYPLSLHGTGLSIGSAEGLDARHLARVREVVARMEPGLVSEHLSWSVSDGVYLGDLLPLPMTEEALAVVCRNVETFQDALRRPMLLENPSSYLRYRHAPIPEWEFLAAVAERTGCGILCDVNNIFVSAANHGWDAEAYLAALPRAAIGEIHLAGHSVRDLGDGRTIRIDDHGARVDAAVWHLYEAAIERFGAVPTLIEWDTGVPPIEVLCEEAATAQAVLDRAGLHRTISERSRVRSA